MGKYVCRMNWYVCKYRSDIWELLPDFYVNEILAYGYCDKIIILKMFNDGGEALEYLHGIVMAECLIEKALE